MTTFDIATGSTTGRDELRSRLNVGAAQATDDELQHTWDTAVQVVTPWVLPQYMTAAPAAVLESVLNVATTLWRNTDTMGGFEQLPDGTALGVSWTGLSRSQIRSLMGPALSARMARSPRVVA